MPTYSQADLDAYNGLVQKEKQGNSSATPEEVAATERVQADPDYQKNQAAVAAKGGPQGSSNDPGTGKPNDPTNPNPVGAYNQRQGDSGFLGLGSNFSDTGFNTQLQSYDQNAMRGGALGAMSAGAQARTAPTINNQFGAADRGNEAQSRGAQSNLLGQLQATANGQGPSVAEQQMRAGTDANINAQMAMANSARGGGIQAAAAQRQAQNQGAQMMAQTNQQVGTLRSQEALNAQNQMMGLTGQMRAQDQGLYGADQQNAQAQAQMQLTRQGQNDQYQLGAEGMIGQQETADLQARLHYQDEQSNNYNSAQDRNRGIASQNSSQNMQTVGSVMQGAGAAVGYFSSDIRLKEDIEPQGRGAKRRNYLSAIVKEEGRGSPEDVAEDIEPQGDGGKRGNYLGALVKEEGRGSPEDVDAFMDSLEPYSYRYKDPQDEPRSSPTGKRYLGIMAQKVEQSPVGKTIVVETPRGKAIEMGPMLSALAAATGRNHERLNELEGAAPKGRRR